MGAHELDVAGLAAGDLHQVVGVEGADAVVDGHLAPLGSPDSPLKSWSTTCCLRSCVTPKSRVGSSVVSPNVAASTMAAHGGRLQQLLGGDAAHVEAGAPDLGHLDQGDVEPGGHAPYRAAA